MSEYDVALNVVISFSFHFKSEMSLFASTY